MSISVGDILRVVAQFAWDDAEIAQCVFNAVIGGAGGPFDDADIVDDAVAWIDAMFTETEDYMAPEINGSGAIVYVRDTVDDDWDEVGTGSWVFVGVDSVSTELPRGVAALVIGRTVDPDVQGKKYLPGFAEGAVNGGLFSAPVLATMLAFLAEWAAPFVGGTSGASWVPSIWSPTNEVAFTMNENGAANGIPAYQRRRKNNVGI